MSQLPKMEVEMNKLMCERVNPKSVVRKPKKTTV